MSISREAILNVAKLARLSIDNTTAGQGLAEDLNRIVGMVNQIQTANTKNVSPMAHPLDLPQPLRKDKITETNQRDLLIAQAPKAEAGLYIVPTVIE